ncbi:MAG: lytic murein transglycosylase B [Paucibacter sp.]|nr:lytic murein transglycosylase B [Roseateles sp.]
MYPRLSLALGAALALSVLLFTMAPAQAARPRKPPPPKDAPPYPLTDKVPAAELARFAIDAGLDAAEVLPVLTQAQIQPSVQRLVMPPPAGKAKDWSAYRALFIEPQRIGAGVEFWNANAAALAKAENDYGVPPEIVVGVIGVETFYGRIMGRYRVLDALATLAFAFPTGRSDRSAFFRTELGEFFKLAKREGADPLGYLGSYAGAMGLAQFMPGSWNRHAIDFDGDGHIDLIGSPADAIGSVAHYLSEYGWQRGMMTHYSVALPADTATRARLLTPDVVPSFTARELQAAGARPSEAAMDFDGKVAVVELQNGAKAASHVLGTSNFYVVTRYNHSSYYAMAVIELGRAVANAWKAQAPGAAAPAP